MKAKVPVPKPEVKEEKESDYGGSFDAYNEDFESFDEEEENKLSKKGKKLVTNIEEIKNAML